MIYVWVIKIASRIFLTHHLLACFLMTNESHLNLSGVFMRRASDKWWIFHHDSLIHLSYAAHWYSVKYLLVPLGSFSQN